ncbi:leucine-rich repeat-domain-containing protein [Glomus cerebriforme]|uniref:U2 small nuclear ribonucleoprotein A' n=1 Tax=Glomus cerebriforme TaxID=658196 RepID=A0A397TFT8_9GLOM|nr:leucine-rich repeat-domain-containing protein [Glomus cerebriforme]
MKLTPELIERSLSYINAVKDRELDLRGNKIPAIENLGVSKDQNDTIDLTDNDIRVLGNFPLLRRVRTLLLANNRITRIDPQIFEVLPNLTTLVLTNNNISELSDLDPLSGCHRLQYISLLDNPVTRKQWYRSWIIWRIKSVRVLDFNRVRDVERKEAKQLFVTSKGEMTSLAKSISEIASKTFEPGEGLVSSKGINLPRSNLPTLGMSVEEQSKIKDAIRNAKTLEEVTRLEKLLQSGHIPGQKPIGESESQVEEEDEEME